MFWASSQKVPSHTVRLQKIGTIWLLCFQYQKQQHLLAQFQRKLDIFRHTHRIPDSSCHGHPIPQPEPSRWTWACSYRKVKREINRESNLKQYRLSLYLWCVEKYSHLSASAKLHFPPFDYLLISKDWKRPNPCQNLSLWDHIISSGPNAVIFKSSLNYGLLLHGGKSSLWFFCLFKKMVSCSILFRA